jgi:hypothetical protein
VQGDGGEEEEEDKRAGQSIAVERRETGYTVSLLQQQLSNSYKSATHLHGIDSLSTPLSLLSRSNHQDT